MIRAFAGKFGFEYVAGAASPQHAQPMPPTDEACPDGGTNTGMASAQHAQLSMPRTGSSRAVTGTVVRSGLSVATRSIGAAPWSLLLTPAFLLRAPAASVMGDHRSATWRTMYEW